MKQSETEVEKVCLTMDKLFPNEDVAHFPKDSTPLQTKCRMVIPPVWKSLFIEGLDHQSV